MKLKNRIIQLCVLTGGVLLFPSCNDFLDREPLDQVTPESYFQNADHLAAYSISKYQNLFSTHSGFSAGTVNNDGATDNMVSGGSSGSGLQNYYTKDVWKTEAANDNWDFSFFRYCNYFFEKVLPKYEAGEISGNADDVKHYIGEMYFIRAWKYFQKLRMYGDYPIITEVLPDNAEILIEKGVRQPRNKVARFILEDLDKAAEYMHDHGFAGNNRLNKQCALLIKSRVALYEATFEKYHQGTGRVPGDANWPGKRVHPDYKYDANTEINFFLDQAMSAAEQVADVIKLTPNSGVFNPANDNDISGWNDYFDMFSAEDMSGFEEVLFWRDYYSGDFTIAHGATAYVASGGNNGMLHNYVQSFLMKDGMPWYAATAAYPFKGDERVMDEKANRDERLQLFLFGEEDMIPAVSNATTNAMKTYQDANYPNIIVAESEIKDLTGYRIRKCLSYDQKQYVSGQAQSTTGCVIFRAVEAYLNYMEAACMKNNGNVTGKAAEYWRAVRIRAGVDPDFTKTIAATDLSKENDLAKYKGENEMIDVTLFNIRRERRCEFIGEGMRMDDLIRWRSLDRLLVERFIPEGFNFWGSDAYKRYEGEDAKFEYIEGPDNAMANVSSRKLSNYLRPYSVVQKNNEIYDGYTWAKAHYLYPVPIRQIELLSPSGEIASSVIYQNPYWPEERNTKTLLANDINLYGWHLPLDAHPELGNNAQLAALLGITVMGEIEPLVPWGELTMPVPGLELASWIEARLGRKPLWCGDTGPEVVQRVAWCTGGGQSFIDSAARFGVDAFITGEVSEQTIHSAREQGLHFYAAGHHATERGGIRALSEWLNENTDLDVTFIDIPNPA